MPETGAKRAEQFIVRLPDGMRDRIKAAADRNNRSMNAEIVATLEQAYPAEAKEFGPLFLQLFDELMEIADRGDSGSLQARMLDANLKLARAGHGRIEFFVISGPPLSVGSRNIDTAQRLRRVEEAAKATHRNSPA